MKTGCTKE